MNNLYKQQWKQRILPMSRILNKEQMEPWLLWLSGLNADLRTKGSPVRFPVRAHA